MRVKAPIPQGYLARKGRRAKALRILDIAILLANVHKGAQDEEIGWEDARNTLQAFTRELNKRIFVDPALLESGLWSCNLQDEKGAFWHPLGLSFDEWTRQLIRENERFNRSYNVIEKEEDK